MALRGVLFDIGGVVQDSPLEFLRAFEAREGLPHRLLSELVGNYGADPDGPWQRLERGELELDAFCERFDAELARRGHPISSRRMMEEMSAFTRVRPIMLDAIGRLRAGGYRVGALTNNWVTHREESEARARLRETFDAFVESCRTGLRKPDPRIYELACRELGLAPPEVAFLDDIGSNLKPARALGMHTIKVESAEQALAALEPLVGMELLGRGGP